MKPFGFTYQSNFVYAFVFYCVQLPVDFFSSIVANLISRHHQYQADHFSVLCGHGEKLRDALIKLNLIGNEDMPNKFSPFR